MCDDICKLTTSSEANNKTLCGGCTFPRGFSAVLRFHLAIYTYHLKSEENSYYIPAIYQLCDIWQDI